VSVPDGWLSLVVARARTAGDVRSLALVAEDGAPLPSFTPGSHIVLDAGGRTNAYSLTGEFLEPTAFELSVLHIPGGAGGSRWVHEQLDVGDRVTVSPPRSAFAPVASARHHLLIAGGIGITPILSHIRAAVMYGRSFEVVYGHRPTHGLAVDQLRELCPPERLRVVTDRQALIATAAERLADQPLGTAAYACGPLAMMDAVTTAADRLGWPAARLRTEAFSVAALEPGEPFVADLRRSGRRVAVRSGVSLLEALEAAGIEVPNLCRQGVCGECRVAVTGGRPYHRDLYLSDEERAAGDSVMCCVSRACDGVLELAL
jgi:dimethylamine monooxygenase subunit B